MSTSSATPTPTRETHLQYLRQALDLARKSPPKPTNFRVGCVIVSFASGTGSDTDKDANGKILSTGYTLELEGNTHAEQCALAKLEQQHGTEGGSAGLMTQEMNVHLYTTLEPCAKRLSGNTSCVERIISTRSLSTSAGGGVGGIQKVIFGAREPGTFVRDSKSLELLDAAGVQWEFIDGLEGEILRVAMEGHAQPLTTEQNTDREAQTQTKETTTNIDDITPEERRRQEEQPRNPKKRMMEVDLSR